MLNASKDQEGEPLLGKPLDETADTSNDLGSARSTQIERPKGHDDDPDEIYDIAGASKE